VGTETVSGTLTVGGSPLAGVAFAATNGGVCASSNASGQYSCTVAYGWTGSVMPSSSGYTFTPASRSYSNVVANQTAQDYTAVILYVVSGTVTAGGSPLAAVAFAASNGGTCTSSNASGQYSCTVVQGWSGSVTPSAGGYTFTPASRSYSTVSAGQSAQDFAAQPVAITAAIFYIHPDHLNTPRMIADSTGTTVWRWDQGEPFGNDVPNNNPSGVGAFDFPLRFPGQYFDRETNLTYNYFRDYDPGAGRYVQSDPMGLDGGLNTYAYVESAPLADTDFYGLITSSMKHFRRVNCPEKERDDCIQICKEQGKAMESCKVTRGRRAVVRNGVKLWQLYTVPGSMSCKCKDCEEDNEPQRFWNWLIQPGQKPADDPFSPYTGGKKPDNPFGPPPPTRLPVFP